MPQNIQVPGNILGGDGTDTPSTEQDFNKNYKELYPEKVNLDPRSETHKKLKNEIMRRAQESERYMLPRHSRFDEIDRTLNMFIDHDEKEKARSERRPVPVVVPESYAIMETFLTYMIFAFGQSPMFKYEGTGPEDTVGAILLEKVIEQQVHRSKMLLELNTLWRDAFAYGFAPGALSWQVKTGKRAAILDTFTINPETAEEELDFSTRTTIEDILFEGNVLNAIDPRLYLPDPQVGIYKVQDGEFVGWKNVTSYNALLKEEAGEGQQLFNVRYLKDVRTRSSIYAASIKDREAKNSLGTQQNQQYDTVHPIDVIWMYIDLIPKDHDLGPEEFPQKWLFALAADEIIIAAHRMDLNHDMFPLMAMAPDAGGHEVLPLARMEVTQGLQRYMNFLVNSRMQEIRRFLMNRFLVDPKLVNMWDVIKGRPAIRTRKTQWGRGVQNAIEQIKLQDTTVNHMSDLGMITQMMRNSTGAVDAVQGLQRQRGERVTASEFQDTRGAALSKLQRVARLISMQFMEDAALMMAVHTQQFMSTETYVKIAGRWEERLIAEYGPQVVDGRAPVDPMQLNVYFDVVAHDGSIAGSEDTQGWLQFYQVLAGNPEVAQGMDMMRVSLHLARLLGAKNAEDFKLTEGGIPEIAPQVMPDSNVLQLQQAGQLEAI